MGRLEDEEKKRQQALYEASPQYMTDLYTKYDSGVSMPDAEVNKVEHDKYINSEKYVNDSLNEELDSLTSMGKVKGYDYEKGYQAPEITPENPQGIDTDWRATMHRDMDAKPEEAIPVDETPKSRSALNRVLDTIQVGQYAIQGGIHGAIDKDQSVLGGIWEGIKASNPFGDGNEKGEYTFSHNMGDLGWTPESKLGKAVKGTVGFIGDVALDPMTYLTLGTGAVLKGTGQKVGKEVVEKFSKEMAEGVLKKQGAEITEDVVVDLVRRVNKARGIVEEGTKKGFGLYGSSVPFAKKLGIADKKIEFISDTALRAFGDNTFAPYMNKLGDLAKHSKLFSTKGAMLDLARKDPEALAMGFSFAQKAGKEGISYADAVIKLKDEYEGFAKLPEESQTLITHILEDPKLWKKVTTYKSLADIKEGQDLKAVLKGFVEDYGMDDPKMKKIMDGITPKFNPGDKITMRLNGVEAPVEIEGIYGYVKGANGADNMNYYKIKGFDKSIPESAFVSKKAMDAELLASAQARKATQIKDSIDKGESGRINLTDERVATDLDDMIFSGEIPSTKKRKPSEFTSSNMSMSKNINSSADETIDDIVSGTDVGSLLKNQKGSVTTTKDGIRMDSQSHHVLPDLDVPERKFNQTVEDANAKINPVDDNGKYNPRELNKLKMDKSSYTGASVKEAEVKTPLYDSNGKLNKSDRVTYGKTGEVTAIDGARFYKGKWKENPKLGIVSQSDIKYNSGLNRQDFKRFITDKVRIDDNGAVRFNNKIVGDATNMKGIKTALNPTGEKTLANLTGLKKFNKNAWNAVKGNEEKERDFFDRLITEEPAIKDMFAGLVNSGDLTLKRVNINSFIDSYFEKPYYKPADMVHTFHKDHDVITKMLEPEFGKYDNLKRATDKGKLINQIDTLKKRTRGVDPETLKGLETKLKDMGDIEPNFTDDLQKRMTKQYDLMNDPEKVIEFDNLTNKQFGKTGFAEGIGVTDGSGVIASEARRSADGATDIKGRADYVLGDERAMDSASEAIQEYTVFKKGKGFKPDGKPKWDFRANVEEAGNGYVWYKTPGSDEVVRVSKANLEEKGYIMFDKKPQKTITGTSIHGEDMVTKSTPNYKGKAEDATSDMLNSGEKFDTPRDAKAQKLETEYQQNYEADIFKASDEISMGSTKSVNMSSKNPDAPMKFTKVKTEVVNGKTVEVGTGREVDTATHVADGSKVKKSKKGAKKSDDMAEVAMSKADEYVPDMKLREGELPLKTEGQFTSIKDSNFPLKDYHHEIAEYKERLVNGRFEPGYDEDHYVEMLNTVETLRGRNQLMDRLHNEKIAFNNKLTTSTDPNVLRQAELDAKIKINTANIKETVDDMITGSGKKTSKPPKKTVAQALSELPDDIQRTLDAQAGDVASAQLLQQKLTSYREMLSSQAEFDRYAKTIWGDTKYDDLMEKHATTIRAIDHTDLIPEDIKAIAEGIRKTFNSVGDMELGVKALDSKMLEGYCAHILNPKYVNPLANFSQKELDDMGIRIPKNGFSNARELKIGYVMPNGYKLEKGTIEEINEQFQNFGREMNAVYNKGKSVNGAKPLENLFEEQISDIYVARLQTHYKTMYSNEVFGDITTKFGNVFDGSKAVKSQHSLAISTKELRDGLKGMDVPTKEEYLKSFGLSNKELNKLGNSFIRVDSDVATKINAEKFAKVHEVPNMVLDKAEKISHVQMAEDVNGLLSVYDKFMRTYKLAVTAYRPAFHINNAKGNMWNTYLDVGSKAMSPRLHKAGIGIIKGADDTIELGGKTFSFKELRDQSKINGWADTGYFKKDVKTIIKGEAEQVSPLRKAFEAPQKLGNSVEYEGKMVNFMANLDRGMSFTEASEHVDKFLFDYSDITKFEHQVMQRIFPFYTWMRKNAPLQVEQMLTNPKKFMPVAKAIGEIEGMTDAKNRVDKSKVPAFAKDWVQLPFNIKNEKGEEEALMWSNNLPYMDVNKIPNIFDMGNSMTNLLQSSAPMIKAPVELATNKNYFFNRPIDQGKNVLDPSGKFEVSPKLAYILAQIPQYAEPAGMVKKKGIDKLIHFFDKGLASGVKSYDETGDTGANNFTVPIGSTKQPMYSKMEDIERMSVSDDGTTYLGDEVKASNDNSLIGTKATDKQLTDMDKMDELTKGLWSEDPNPSDPGAYMDEEDKAVHR